MCEQEKGKLHISVRDLVEFIFREGDIDNRGGRLPNADAMMEGSRLHRKIQQSKGAGYQAEVPLKYKVENELYELTIDGRADGIFTNEDGLVVIDEIKGVYKNLEHLLQPIFVHQAQAMCYAYIVAEQENLSEIEVQMTYCHMESEQIRRFNEVFDRSENEEETVLSLINVMHYAKKYFYEPREEAYNRFNNKLVNSNRFPN